jgi:hypothetical protein
MIGFRALTILVTAGIAVSSVAACKQKSRASHRGRIASAPEGSGTAADAGGGLETMSASVANGFPERFRRELARSPEWHHLLLSGGGDVSQALGGDIMVMTGSRIWRPQVQDGMATGLNEETSEKSQYIVNARTQEVRVTWIRGKVDLSAPGRFSDWTPLSLDMDDLVFEGAPGASGPGGKSMQNPGGAGAGQVFNLRTVEGRNAALQRMRQVSSKGASKSVSKSVSKGMTGADDDLIKGDVEFMFWKDGRFGFKEGGNLHIFRKRNPLPAMAVVTPAQRKLNMFVAPFMMADDVKAGFAPIAVDDMPLPAYAHHNTSVAKDVLLDKDFPDALIANLEKSLDSWNQLLGVQYFKIRKAGRKLDKVDCMTLSSVCVFWNGSDRDISAAGIGGMALSSYDPLTGVVDGGMISFMNLAAGGTTPTGMPPQALSDMLTGKSVDGRAAAEWQYKTTELGNYRHPAPEMVLSYVMIHEFGHYLGLRHNFAASVYANPRVTTSVMEYPPYALRSGLAGGIGSFDVATINAIYGRGGGDGEETQFCSDKDATPAADPRAATDPRFEGQITKMAPCVRMDYGDPVQWWIDIALAANEGTLADIPGSEFMKMMMLFTPVKTVNNGAEQLGFFLRPGSGATPQQAEKARAFLCSRPAAEKAAVAEQLARDMGVALRCN